MQFSEDKISDFIRFKLNNPHALQEEMRLIEDRLECNRKLQEYAKQMESLKNQLSIGKSTLQALVARRQYILNVSEEQKMQLEMQITECKQQLQNIKRETREKHNSSQFYQKRFEQFQNDMMIKKQALIQSHQQELAKLDEQTENLKFEKEARAAIKEELEYKLKKMKDRERIINNAVQNVENIKSKWGTRYHELAVAKEELQKKDKQITDLINYSNSMQKVIYNNLYKRCSNFIAELTQGLDNLYNEKTVNMNEIGWEQRVQKQISKLKVNKQKFTKLLKEKREKYSVSSGLPQPNPDEYNLIVQTKINPEMLQYIDPSKYKISQQKYFQIQEAQNAQLDKLQAEKVSLESQQRSRISQIQNLRKRIAALEEQIQIKQRTLMSPSKKKK